MSTAVPSFVSVKFDPVGRVRRFLLEGVEFEPPLKPGDEVVVSRGDQRAYATVAATIPQIAERVAPPPKSADRLVRRATPRDVAARAEHRRRERDAYRICALKINEHRLPMKLVRAEQQLDRAHLVLYFTADGRVDFRELVRDLATARAAGEERRLEPVAAAASAALPSPSARPGGADLPAAAVAGRCGGVGFRPAVDREGHRVVGSRVGSGRIGR